MDAQKVLDIVRKHVDEKGMLKDLASEFVKPYLASVKAKIESGEIDLIPGTDLDKMVLLSAIDFLLAQVEAA